MNVTGARGRTDSGRGGLGGVGAHRRRRGHEMAAEDVASADVPAWRGRAEGHRHGQGHRTTAAMPAWTRQCGTAAWDVAVDVAARTTVGADAAATALGGVEEESGTAAADEATGRPQGMSPL